MKQHYLVMDVGICHDCNNCFMACKDEHVDNDFSPISKPQPRHGHRWCNLERTERSTYPRVDVGFLMKPCQHCENAPCMENAGDAIYRREDGIVLIDNEKAKGKKELVDSCPYGAIYWNEEYDIPQKCTMCAHLLDDGWTDTRCSHSCPTYSIMHYNVEPEEMAKMIKEEDLRELNPGLATKPHVFYKNLFRFNKHFIGGSVLVDGDCFEGAKVTLTGEGKDETQTTNFFGDFKFDDLDNGTYTICIEGGGKKADLNVAVKDESPNLNFIELK